jgi:hypothetical protein
MNQSPVVKKNDQSAALANPNLEELPALYGWPSQNSSGYRIVEKLSGTERRLRVIHIGAGASGICFSKFAAESLHNVEWVCYDKNGDIGGTWLENR